MSLLILQYENHRIENPVCSNFLKALPNVILKHTDWRYSYQETDSGCLLKPTFHNMPYRNAFLPEIDIVVLNSDKHTVLQMRGQPVLFVRVFMAIWFIFLLIMEFILLALSVTSTLNSIFPVFIPIGMCVFGYFLCKSGTKATFNSIVKAIKYEYCARIKT